MNSISIKEFPILSGSKMSCILNLILYTDYLLHLNKILTLTNRQRSQCKPCESSQTKERAHAGLLNASGIDEEGKFAK